MGIGLLGALGIASVAGQATGDLINTGLGYWSTHQSQKANKSRWAQEIELANTAHQREVDDLRAAGLNPILSTGTAGAAVPQQAAAEYANPMSGASGISDALHTAASLAVADKQADSIGYDAALKKIEVDAYHNASAAEKAQIQQGIRDEMLMRGAPKNAIETGYMGLRKGKNIVDEMVKRPQTPTTAAPAISNQRKSERFSSTPNEELPALPLVAPKNLINEYKAKHGKTPTAKELELYRRQKVGEEMRKRHYK